MFSRNHQNSFERLCLAFILSLLSTLAVAHQGHRFVIHTDNNKLYAQGVNTESPVRFNEPHVRPYRNVIHHNWSNFAFNGEPTALSLLPGFDIPASESSLTGHDVNLRLNRIVHWENPPKQPGAIVNPVWRALYGEAFTMTLGVYRLGNAGNASKSIPLASRIGSAGSKDIDPKYQLQTKVENSIYVLDVTLSTTAEGIANSDSVYIILGPPGYAYHDTLMHLEQYLSENGIKAVLDAEPNMRLDRIISNPWVLLMILLIVVGLALYVYAVRKNTRQQ